MIVPDVSILGQYLQVLVLQMCMGHCVPVLVGVFAGSLGSLACTKVSLRFLFLLLPNIIRLLWIGVVVLVLPRMCQFSSTTLVAGWVPGVKVVIRKKLSISLVVSCGVGGFRSCVLSTLRALMRESSIRSSGYCRLLKCEAIMSALLSKSSSRLHMRRSRRNWLYGRLLLVCMGWAESYNK